MFTESKVRHRYLEWKCKKTQLWLKGGKEKPCGIDCLATIVCLASPLLRGDLSTKRPLITEWEGGGVLFRGRAWPPIHLHRDPDTHTDPEVQVQGRGRGPSSGGYSVRGKAEQNSPATNCNLQDKSPVPCWAVKQHKFRLPEQFINAFIQLSI